MYEFIIEKELENVKNKITKECLKEVISSYNNENYRSAVVMLYSTVIVDLLNKLKELDEIYNDKKAKEILNEVKKSQQNGTSKSEWEKKLLTLIKDKTELLNEIELKKINFLHEERNLSAHPVCNEDYVLISPNREEVRAHIRNMFEIIFTKEALLCKNIVNEFLEDISEYYEKIGNVESFERYVRSKYYSRLNNVVKKKLFRSLWKLTFCLDDENSKKNRLICYYSLIHLVKNDIDKFIETMSKEKAYYSNLSKSILTCKYDDKHISIDKTPTVALIHFLARYNKFYDLLEDHAKEIIKNEANKNINLKILTYYMSNNLNEHIEQIKLAQKNYYQTPNWTYVENYSSINLNTLHRIYIVANEKFMGPNVKQFAIDYVTNACSYNDAEYLLNSFLRTFIEDLDINEYKCLLNNMNSNSQIYELRNILKICNSIKGVIENKFPNKINYETYKNLKFD